MPITKTSLFFKSLLTACVFSSNESFTVLMICAMVIFNQSMVEIMAIVRIKYILKSF